MKPSLDFDKALPHPRSPPSTKLLHNQTTIMPTVTRTPSTRFTTSDLSRRSLGRTLSRRRTLRPRTAAAPPTLTHRSSFSSLYSEITTYSDDDDDDDSAVVVMGPEEEISDNDAPRVPSALLAPFPSSSQRRSIQLLESLLMDLRGIDGCCEERDVAGDGLEKGESEKLAEAVVVEVGRLPSRKTCRGPRPCPEAIAAPRASVAVPPPVTPPFAVVVAAALPASSAAASSVSIASAPLAPQAPATHTPLALPLPTPAPTPSPTAAPTSTTLASRRPTVRGPRSMGPPPKALMPLPPMTNIARQPPIKTADPTPEPAAQVSTATAPAKLTRRKTGKCKRFFRRLLVA
ncbi:hypothetical protein BDK51DRAFT_48881 [Blyttiomyces helicus]|uniref:Uncharacterized protein n=1 Tax=Blyttiomyces helicus TaxID=388810 RepID=A0A4P9W0E8_9FUNG|nr:hypothetical protein BDK51DRAFT_48881 [Blyttiomyces helicus]|eukprot:RKO84573.1 hypothetical protein BDK51DRAFT_48881 [Blyttiomyces helicus]